MILLLAAWAHAGTPADKVAGKDAAWLQKHLVTEDDALLRAAIVTELALAREVGAVGDLVRAATDRDARVRRAALEGLFGMGVVDAGADDAVLTGLSDVDPEVRQAARKAAAARVRSGATDVIGSICTLARRAETWTTRQAAVLSLEGAPAGDPVDPALVEVARLDDHPEVRRAAAVALGVRGVAAGAAVLGTLRRRDPDEHVRLAAEEALARLGGPTTSLVVAVMPFEARAKEGEVFAAGLQDRFTTLLAAEEVATVVERRQVAQVLAELVFQDSNIDDGRAVQIGKLLRAQQVVTGTILVRGSAVTCLAKRVDVVTGAVAGSAEVVGELHDLESLGRECATRLARTF